MENTRFQNLGEAGRLLAAELKSYRGRHDVLVLGLARGGVPVAVEVAKALQLPLDIVLIRRLLTPEGPSAPLCVFNLAGKRVVDAEIPVVPTVPVLPFDYFLLDALEKFSHCERLCRGEKEPLILDGKTLLLVDNGISTGGTVHACIRALRTQEPARIILAVPTASVESRKNMQAIADEVVCLSWRESFGNVALWYRAFNVPTFEKIYDLLSEVGADLEHEQS